MFASRRTMLLLAVACAILIFLSATYKNDLRERIDRIRTWSQLDQDDFSDIKPIPDMNSTKPPNLLLSERPVIDWVDHDSIYMPDQSWRVLYSQSTSDLRYFHIDMAGVEVYNPSILPHPSQPGKYIVIALALAYRKDIGHAEQLVCIAEFKEGVLHCPRAPTSLPIATSIEGDCKDNLGAYNIHRGSRDARVLYGPYEPYIIYGSQSHWPGMCIGLWVQNFWSLLNGARHSDEGFASSVTEIGRPGPYDPIQKNFFLFWSDSGEVLSHYSMWPERSFSLLNNDGSAAHRFLEPEPADLGKDTEKHDQECMSQLFRKVEQNTVEGIHQATNSLSITMCTRSENCRITNDNTFILTIIQWKKTVYPQSIYEPYPLLFRRSAPYALYAVARKPLFYYGTNVLRNRTHSGAYRWNDGLELSPDYLTMMYTSSISWKNPQQTYHGYLDDILFINFGVEDTSSGSIDVLASDLFKDLGYCV